MFTKVPKDQQGSLSLSLSIYIYIYICCSLIQVHLGPVKCGYSCVYGYMSRTVTLGFIDVRGKIQLFSTASALSNSAGSVK